jgi:hypothetical protein
MILSSWYTRVLRETGRPRPNSGCEEMRTLLRILNNFKVITSSSTVGIDYKLLYVVHILYVGLRKCY